MQDLGGAQHHLMPQHTLQASGQGAGRALQLSNYDLLNKDWVPGWFRSEQTLNMPQEQLREAMIHMRCSRAFTFSFPSLCCSPFSVLTPRAPRCCPPLPPLQLLLCGLLRTGRCHQMIANGEPILSSSRMVSSMKVSNKKNQVFHDTEQHHEQAPHQQARPPPQQGAGGWIGAPRPAHWGAAQAAQSKKGTTLGGGVQKPRNRASSLASIPDWAPLAQSKRTYPNERKESPYTVRVVPLRVPASL